MMGYQVFVDDWEPKELERFLLKTIGGERNADGDWYVDGAIWHVDPPRDSTLRMAGDLGFTPTAKVLMWAGKLSTVDRPVSKAVKALLERPGNLVLMWEDADILRRVDGKVWLDDPDKWTLGPALKKYLDEHPPG